VTSSLPTQCKTHAIIVSYAVYRLERYASRARDATRIMVEVSEVADRADATCRHINQARFSTSDNLALRDPRVAREIVLRFPLLSADTDRTRTPARAALDDRLTRRQASPTPRRRRQPTLSVRLRNVPTTKPARRNPSNYLQAKGRRLEAQVLVVISKHGAFKRIETRACAMRAYLLWT
jgi:hypothetical protein